jgi:hypothetical protein
MERYEHRHPNPEQSRRQLKKEFLERKNMLTSSAIGAAGEKIVTAALTRMGYSCYRNTQQAGSTDIEATSSTKNLLVQVKTSVYPDVPADLSGEERRNITSRATRLGYEAWQAKVQINDNEELVGQINWLKLN